MRINDPGSRRVLACPDSFKGSASAQDLTRAIEVGAVEAGWSSEACPMSDGGEGFSSVLGVLGGEVRRTKVTGPLGSSVEAIWRRVGDMAVIESAEASGLVLAGGASGNDPVRATSRGTGELVVAAVAEGAEKILVGLGGSATTDGGIGAVEAVVEAGGTRGAEVVVAADTRVTFTDAATVYGPQKGATPAQVEKLTARLLELASAYRDRYGIDVARVPGSGAAGGLAGGLAAIGAVVRPGFEVVAEAVQLQERARRADLVVTGEGRLDATSWTGKVVGGVAEIAAGLSVPLLVIAGEVSDGATVPEGAIVPVEFEVVSLGDRFGKSRSLGETLACVAEVVAYELGADELGDRLPSRD